VKKKIIIKTQPLIVSGLLNIFIGGAGVFWSIKGFLNEDKTEGYMGAIAGIICFIIGFYILFRKRPILIFEKLNNSILIVHDKNNILKLNSKQYDISQITNLRIIIKKDREGAAGNIINITYQNHDETLIDLDNSTLSRKQILEISNFISMQDYKISEKFDESENISDYI